MTNSRPSIAALGIVPAQPNRPPPVPAAQSGGYVSESELSKLIRYGCQFELEVHQMVELSRLRAENQTLRRNVRTGAAGSGAAE